MVLIASCSETPNCVSPAGLSSAPSALSMCLCIMSTSSPSWFDWNSTSVDLELLRQRLQALVELGERHAAVDVRLAPAEQVQVGAVQDQDLHFLFQFFSRLAISAGLKWQCACSRA